MILFEGYKKAVEIYNKYSGTDNGRTTVTWYNNELGVSKEYLVWFTSCIVCYNIPLYIVLNAYKDWKRYVVSYYKKTGQSIPNIETLNYQQTMKIINECKRQWAKPNPIYNLNGVYVGEFKSFNDANMLPINTDWCITKTKSRYNEFNNENSKCLYIINNRNQDPWRRVIAVVYTDRVEYWDSTNIRMDDNASYENTLPSEVVDIIHSKCQKTNENKQHKTRYNMKKTIRLSESDLHRVIKESVKRILREQEEQGKYYWIIKEWEPSKWRSNEYDVVGEIDHSESFFNSPEDAYSEGLQRLGYYTEGDYSLEIFQYFGGQNSGGEYLNKPGAEIHNGVIKEY